MLQIRGDRDILEIFSRISPEKIFCDPPLEPSRRDGSNEGSQHMFSLTNKKNYLWIILNTPSYLKLWGAHATVGFIESWLENFPDTFKC